MSGLAALVALVEGRRAPGVYAWDSAATVEDAQHAAGLAGWRLAHVDGGTHPDKPAFLAAVGHALAFPSWYGANLDALRDCLWDVVGPTVLLWDGWEPLARADAATFGALREIFEERAAEAPALAVLLRGTGPAVGVPPLEA